MRIRKSTRLSDKIVGRTSRPQYIIARFFCKVPVDCQERGLVWLVCLICSFYSPEEMITVHTHRTPLVLISRRADSFCRVRLTSDEGKFTATPPPPV